MCFNTLEVDSNSDKIVFYDSELYLEDKYTLYFDNLNYYDLDNIFRNSNIRIISYIIEGNKYYVRNTLELYDKYITDKSLKDKIFYEEYGFNIDGINVICNTKDIIELNNKVHVY